ARDRLLARIDGQLCVGRECLDGGGHRRERRGARARVLCPSGDTRGQRTLPLESALSAHRATGAMLVRLPPRPEGARMTAPIRVRVHASARLSEAGVTAELKQWPEVSVVADADEADVAIVVADDVDRDAVRM